MATPINSVGESLHAIQNKLKGRNVKIVGVTKGQPLSKIEEAIKNGLQDLGVNYVQQGEELRKQIKTRWHFIGQIQSRKVKNLLDYDLIHGLDRIEIAENLNARLEKEDKKIDVLIEINIGEEPSKAGILPDQIQDFHEALKKYRRIRCRGLMVMPPPLIPVEKRRPFFQRAKTILDSYAASGWDTLSMGTSDDYEVAVDEGATLLRLGTILFGARA